MTSYIIKRLLTMIPTLLLLTVVIFFVVYLIPGDAIDALQSQSSQQEINREVLEKELGLDAPVYVQYARWMGIVPGVDGERSGLLQGDFGYSIVKKESVTKMLGYTWPVTLELALMGLLVNLLISIPIGIYSAARQETIGDYIGRSIAILFVAIPAFWLGMLIIVFPAIWWGYMPSIMLIKFVDDAWGNLMMFLVPSIVLGLSLAGSTMRMSRTMMLEVLRQDYIRTAWAKGLNERTIIARHALKNSIIPVISVVGVQIPYLLGGTVVIEQIFSLPGMGRLIISALQLRDEILIDGIILIFAVVLMLINLIIDLSYAYLNPNVRFK